MISNQEIAAAFEEMADLLELKGENAFRVRAYRNGAKAISDHSDSIASWIKEEKDITAIEGIGSTLAEKTAVLVQTGALPQLEKLRKEVPHTLRDIMRIPGLGAKKAMRLFLELQIADLPQLRQACERGLIAELKGFGVKSQSVILQNMAIAEKAAQRLDIESAGEIARQIHNFVVQCDAVCRAEFAGSFRRHKETSGDLDLLVTSRSPEVVMAHFSQLPMIHEEIVRGETKMSVRVRDSFQVDLRVVDEECWGAALQYFTGSKEHNVKIRSLAKSIGLKINEYGVFRVENDQRIAGESEEEIYRMLGLPWIPPELREDRFEFDEDIAHRIESLIRRCDIRGDLHMHTIATDGENTIEEMAKGAEVLGLEYIAITDHSKRVSMARGLDEARLLEQWKEIDAFNRSRKSNVWVFKGIECDILENGDMDLSDDCLAQADWVTASIHYGQRQTRDQITDRILNAIGNPYVHAISHPTGRLINRREPYEVDLNAVIDAAHQNNKILELNANPSRLDLSDVHVMNAVAKGVTIVINTDAHSISNLDLMEFGIQQARRAGVSANQVLNTLPLEKIKTRLSRKI